MDADDILYFQEEMGELFDDCIPQELEYHLLNLAGPGGGGSTIDPNFGFIKERTPGHPVTTSYTLGFSMEQKAHRAKKIGKASDEWEGKWDVKIYIPTAHVIAKGCYPMNRDNSFFRLPDGTEWRIEAIRELPKTGYGSSVMHKCYCSKRTPQEDNPGNYG